MTPEQFTALVSSKRSSDRRIAGREIAINPTLAERSVIEAAYHNESVPQIRQQFAVALEALNAQKAAAAETPADQAKAIYNEAYLKAMRMVTQSVLHQLNPIIGDIEQSAATEITDYAGSQTAARIGQIKLQAAAISKLYNAAKPPAMEEFDLASLIRNCLPNDLEHHRCQISFQGPAPLMVQGDTSLITMAVTNGLRNAIEACLPVATHDLKPAIIVTWDATERDYWISILDEGVGFHGSIPGAFEIGTSTKGHGGHGLPAVRAAMLSLSGTAELIPQKDKGCTLSLTWPIIDSQK